MLMLASCSGTFHVVAARCQLCNLSNPGPGRLWVAGPESVWVNRAAGPGGGYRGGADVPPDRKADGKAYFRYLLT